MINPSENVNGHRSETTFQYDLENIHPMDNHPFGVRDDEEMAELTESIRRYGVLDPIIVRKRSGMGGGYEIVGDGELREELTNHVKRSEIENSVIFTGSVSNVPDYLSAMDIFVLPSLHEGFAISALEAQANGLITICSDSIPKDVKLTEWITFLPLSEGVDVWAEAILTLYKNGGNGHKTVTGDNALQEYEINECMNHLISLLDYLCF